MSGESQGPARGYSWPPFEPGNDLGEKFEPGNQAAVRHGAQSPALVEPRARELAPVILDANPHLSVDRDGAAVFRYAMTLARIERVYAWLSEQADPVFSEPADGDVHRVYERLERWERQADTAEDRLAIAPLTRAKLGLDQLRGVQAVEEVEAAREARARLDARAGQLGSAAETEDGGETS